ncbi:M13 family metallopeptidase [Chromobacterium paludis]|uniref:M13 family metallopeptidase n=1 Tax=Chromobacterium paludis TaxID=2605945 RepID=A0A5C1DLI6_9NEIS|nr:M13 family metallopeptidase [Chromobacterium paludis]QEL57463.1 M13 family metallopeptidase [Chromobacterium paludis]
MKLKTLLPLVLSLSLQAAWAAPANELDYGPYGIDLKGIDHSVRIQDNVSLYANGAWMKQAQIPAERSSTGVGEYLYDLNQQRVREIIEQAAAKPDTAEARKIADLYHSFMDEAAIEKLGLKPLHGQLHEIAGLSSNKQAVAYMAKLQGQPVDAPFHFYVSQDPKNSSAYLAGVSQSGLSMDRDYYLGKSADFAKARKAYQAYLGQLLTLAGEKRAAARAKAVLAFETRLASIQWSNVENRDIQKTYNKVAVGDLSKRLPGYDWTVLLANAQLAKVDAINLDQPTYFAKLSRLLAATPLPVLRDYLSLRTLDAYAPDLAPAWVAAHFDFYGKALDGRGADRPRWKKAVSLVNGGLGEAVGKLYVAKYFTPEAKRQADELVHNLLKAYDQSIDTLSWMEPATKKEAHAKLAKYTPKIGYPDKWRDYSALAIQPDDLAGNVARISQFNYQRDVKRLGQPVDRAEWGMTPQTVNAYYNPANNEIVFPAAILQSPYFDPKFDLAVNYGSIGATIGHEISHGFDDQGHQFDGDGNMRNWWTPADEKHFKEVTAKLVKQYSRFEPVKGHYVNGELTLGENIADNAGLEIAYKAYHIALGGKEAPVIDGMTGDQRFFIAFAQSWRSKTRDGATLQQMVSDPHTPDMYRPIGTVSNLDPFYQAFGVKPGDKMYLPPAQRFHLWW